MKEIIALDIGGTKIYAAVMESNGNIIDKIYVPTNSEEGVEKLINKFSNIIEDLISKNNLKKREIMGIGISIAGVIDFYDGKVVYSPNLYNWNNVPLQYELEKLVNIPVFIENDANAFTYGEWWKGNGNKVNDMVGLTIGTGIGGGLIVDRKIIHGYNGGGGEIGHMIIDPNGYICGCGKKGCFEALASGTALNRYINEYYEKTNLNVPMNERINSYSIFNNLDNNDFFNIFDNYLNYLAIGISNLINIIDPELIVLGGGVSESFDEKIIEMLENKVKKLIFKESANNLKIKKALLEKDAAIFGAAANVMQNCGIYVD